MKLPTFSLSIFKKPTKKKRIITTFGKRGSSASSSTRKSRRPSSSRKTTRKRSITYYAPSKFYPTEHFPSLQRVARQVATVATTPLAVRSYPSDEQSHTVSTDIDGKLNGYLSPSGTFRSYIAKQTYLCDNDYGDIILHQPPAWYMQSKPHQNGYHTETMVNDLRASNINSNPIQTNKLYSNTPVDSNGNMVYDDNCLNNTYGHATSYSKECVQGVPISSMLHTAPPLNDSNIKYNTTELHRQTQHNLLPSNVTTAYNNTVFTSANNSTTNTKCLPNNINNNFCTAYQTNANQLSTNSHFFTSPIYNTALPFKKKSDRHRRRKVRS